MSLTLCQSSFLRSDSLISSLLLPPVFFHKCLELSFFLFEKRALPLNLLLCRRVTLRLTSESLFLLQLGFTIGFLFLTEFDRFTDHSLLFFLGLLIFSLEFLGLFEGALHHLLLFSAFEAVSDAQNLAQLSFLLLLFFVGKRCLFRLGSFTLRSRVGFSSCRCLSFLSVLFLHSLVHLDSLPIQLLVSFHHQTLESQEAINCHDLVDYLFVDGIGLCPLTRLNELSVADSQLSHEFFEQVLHDFLEILRAEAINTLAKAYDRACSVLTLWILVNSSLCSSSSSNTWQYSSMKLITGVFQRGDRKKPMIMSKNQSYAQQHQSQCSVPHNICCCSQSAKPNLNARNWRLTPSVGSWEAVASSPAVALFVAISNIF